ncbi:hypothetical protein Enr13x_31970 [Stieleria neptunia]|uniref:Pilus assembly protein, PilO n=1 Tax=Stieleria neptunia TaxID=2527979 RepID=A0A518HR55_9BACT|nr:hypothetical protein [Stieleria neptunia]QDV43342.1 hypothetical protein Enr13x_31970 [Stieleria neptunia]
MNHPNHLHRNNARWGTEPAPHLRWVSTPLRCHVVCGIIATGLIALASTIWIYPEILAADPSHSPQQIADAIELISSRNRLQNEFNQADERRRLTQQRIDQIAAWLPHNRSWENVRSSLQNEAAACGVQLIALDRGRPHQGKRIAVLEAECEIRGSYPDICRFLQRSVTADLPIWCDEIRLIRAAPDDRAAAAHAGNPDPVRCLATVSLRIPSAGKDTTAAKLLKRSSDHET